MTDGNEKSILGDLRDAVALGRLLVISGAGISQNLPSARGGRLPNWGELIQGLRTHRNFNESALAIEKRTLLDELLPVEALDKLHGDALIEAAEILRGGFASNEFESAIAELCKVEEGSTSQTHLAIAEICPTGIITFNYDGAHEQAFKQNSAPYASIPYDDDGSLKEILSRRDTGEPFILKAHGCITRPASLVLTSSSYRSILSRNRVYRAFLQHSLIHYTILAVGFAMRDRDFDQLLSTLEVEIGLPLHRHAFITKLPGTDPEGRAKRAEFTAISSRFGVEPIYIAEYSEIPKLIQSIGATPGPLIEHLVTRATSEKVDERICAHNKMETLGPIGRRQMRRALLERLDDDKTDVIARSEVIYALGVMGDGGLDVSRKLCDEVRRAAANWNAAAGVGQIECAAHALVSLRQSRISDQTARAGILASLREPELIRSLSEIDSWLKANGGVPRLVTYAEGAAAEIETAGGHF